MFTQLVKMLILATFFPDSESVVGSDFFAVSLKASWIRHLRFT